MSKPLKAFLITTLALLVLALSAGAFVYHRFEEEFFLVSVGMVLFDVRRKSGKLPSSYQEISQAAPSGKYQSKLMPEEWQRYEHRMKPTMKLRESRNPAAKSPDIEIKFDWFFGGRYLITTDPPDMKRISPL